ncbi:MAG: thioredoxin family protein [Planctomycetota bacterium]
MNEQHDMPNDADGPLAVPPKSSLKSRVVWPLVFVMVGIGSWGLVNFMATRSANAGGAPGGGEVLQGWETQLRAGFARAEAEGKPLLVYFTAEWCPPCQDFKAGVLTQPAVDAELKDKTVPLVIDTDTLGRPDRQAELQLMTLMNVQGIPDMYLFSAQGRPMAQYRYDMMSRDPVADFTGWLSEVVPAAAPATQPAE